MLILMNTFKISLLGHDAQNLLLLDSLTVVHNFANLEWFRCYVEIR